MKRNMAVGVIVGKHSDSPVLIFRSNNKTLGQGNKLCPTKLPHYYNVLGYFHITDIWYDQFDKKCWMIKAETIDLETPSWWSAKDSQFVPPTMPFPKAPMETCIFCEVESKQIYSEGWACLHPSCEHYFDFGKVVDTTGLHYNPLFLQERTTFSGEVPSSIAPNLPSNTNEGKSELDIPFKRGILCPQCGCCSRRIHWTYWVCENEECGFEHRATQQIITTQAAIGDIDKSSAKSKEIMVGGITRATHLLGAYEVIKYTIPGKQGQAIGFVCVFKANHAINSQPSGPDELFMQMQEDEFDLKRNPARQANCKCPSHFDVHKLTVHSPGTDSDFSLRKKLCGHLNLSTEFSC